LFVAKRQEDLSEVLRQALELHAVLQVARPQKTNNSMARGHKAIRMLEL
jgi:hypothetical protein